VTTPSPPAPAQKASSKAALLPRRELPNIANILLSNDTPSETSPGILPPGKPGMAYGPEGFSTAVW
jgi:hypothetical protein